MNLSPREIRQRFDVNDDPSGFVFEFRF